MQHDNILNQATNTDISPDHVGHVDGDDKDTKDASDEFPQTKTVATTGTTDAIVGYTLPTSLVFVDEQYWIENRVAVLNAELSGVWELFLKFSRKLFYYSENYKGGYKTIGDCLHSFLGLLQQFNFVVMTNGRFYMFHVYSNLSFV